MATISLDIALFRERFPEFSNETTYPDSLLNVQYTMGTCYISDNDCGRLSGDCRELALQLMLAHLISLNDRISSGAPSGQIVSASEDGVSVSLTPPPDTDQFSWWLNITPYGQNLNTILSSFSVGGFYLGGAPERSGFRKIGGVF